jgi:hypothetical protein
VDLLSTLNLLDTGSALAANSTTALVNVLTLMRMLGGV